MKKYILIGNVNGIGGWQSYIAGRCQYISSKGVQIYIIGSEDKTTVKLKPLMGANIIWNSHVYHSFESYRKNQIEKILAAISEGIEYKAGDDVFIEATSINSSIWGEALAKRFNGISFDYLLHSHIETVNPDYIDFYIHKYKQHLLAGMVRETIPELFGDAFSDKDIDTCGLQARGLDNLTNNNYIKEVTDNIYQYKNKGYYIVGYFGNLDKPHLKELSMKLTSFFHRNSSHKFLFLTVGSSYKNAIEKYLDIEFNKVENASHYNIPELLPVPTEVFSVMDVCIASWGSAKTASTAGTLTIRLTSDTIVEPQGIIGITIFGSDLQNQPIGKESLEEYLNKILFLNAYKKEDIKSEKYFSDFELAHKKIDEFCRPFEHSQLRDKHFDVNSIRCYRRIDKIIKIMNTILGIRLTEICRKIFKRFS